MPRKYLVAIIRAWWIPLCMGVVLGTVTTTWSVVESLEAVDPLLCSMPVDPDAKTIPDFGGQ